MPPVVLAVAIDDVTARACLATADDAAVGFVRVSHGSGAAQAIRDWKPTVVALGTSLWRDEIRMVEEAATEVGALVVQVPDVTSRLDVARGLVQTAVAAGRWR